MKQIVVVENMSCQNCIKHVTSHFLTLEGVSTVEVNLDTKEVILSTEKEHELSEFQTSLQDTVYEVLAIKE
jgi:copper chaperone CopZ